MSVSRHDVDTVPLDLQELQRKLDGMSKVHSLERMRKRSVLLRWWGSV